MEKEKQKEKEKEYSTPFSLSVSLSFKSPSRDLGARQIVYKKRPWLYTKVFSK
jgi:hypothetical protein